jgi:molecular chaperone GrpE
MEDVNQTAEWPTGDGPDREAPDSAALVAERDRLQSEKAEIENRLLRRQADFENFRKRAERERSEILEYAGMEAIRNLLPVVDDFERALKIESADKEYARGMELIYQRTLDVLQKLGLEPINAVGEKFNPHIHHAVEMAPSEEAEDQTVLAEFQRGYNFRGRLLRPAMVKVAVRPDSAS